MRRITILIIVLLVIVATFVVCIPTTVVSQILTQNVTVTELIKNPESYVGKTISVSGFRSLRGEDNVYSAKTGGYVRTDLYTLQDGPAIYLANIKSGLTAEQLQASRAIYNAAGEPIGSTYLKSGYVTLTGVWQLINFGNKTLYALVMQ